MPQLPRAASSGFSGSVPTGEATSGTLDLSLHDALNRAIKYNLALVESNQRVRTSRAQRLLALSQIMPSLNIRPSATELQINLLAYGFPLPPGTPPVVGPFHVFDLRGYLADSVSLQGWRSFRAGSEAVRASELSVRDARDQVVEIVIDLYLQATAVSARITSAEAQVNTADQLYRQAVDRKTAGTAPGIDVLRAQVELQAQQQRLIYYQGQFDIQKLALARAIGLPPGQQFRLTEDVPYAPLPPDVSLESSLAAAYKARADYQAAEALVRAAALNLSGARAARLPSLSLSADYGAIGPQIDQTHGTFTVAGAMNIPIFEGGRIRAGIDQAEAEYETRKAERDDLRGRIDADVRTALLNLRSAGRQVEVARSNVDLARQQLQQSRDRFAAGVTNNLEVVQAQDAVAVADENLISSLYGYNTAKAALIRARGEADESVVRFLTGK
jgi:outer membrane protein TolC